MGRFNVPTEWEKHVIKMHGFNPDEFAVMYSDGQRILLLHFKTRDYIEIRRGDRQW